MVMFNFRSLFLVLALSAVSILSNTLSAATLEEVIVTAQKREQSAQDIGISISSLDAETMRNFSINESSDITNRIPNVENGSFGPGWNAQVAIRGVVTDDFNDLSESPVAMYLDDMYLVALGAGTFPVFDMDRVEVLRGPQGTLFGRNTTGGVINFKTANPDPSARRVTGEATIAEHNEYIVTGSLNSPITDNLTGRAAFYRRKNDGWIKNITNGNDSGVADVWGVRGKLLYEPTADLSALLTYQYNKSDGNTLVYGNRPSYPDARGFVHVTPKNYNAWGVGGVCPAQCPPASLGGIIGFFPAAGPGTDQIGTPLSVSDLKGNYTAIGQYNKIGGESHLAVLDVEDKIGDVQLTSITGFNRYKRDARVDCDGGPVPFCNVFFGFKSTEVSEEFRAYWETDRSRWTTGGYFLYQDGDIGYFAHQDVSGVVLGIGPGFPVDTVFGATQYAPGTYPGGLSFDVLQNQKLYSFSGFAHVEYDLTPKLTGILGVRLGYDDKKTNMGIRLYVPANDPSGYIYSNSPTVNTPAFVLSPFDFTSSNPAVGNLNKINNFNVTGKAELDWHPNNNWLIYASVKRGIKAAAFNNGFVAPSSLADVPVKKEILWAYEGGFKATMFDDRLRLNTSAFYYDYKDFQGVQFVSFGSFIGNYDATIIGLESELNAQVTDRLSLSLYAGFLDSKIRGVKPVQDLVQPAYRGLTYNREMIFAPPWNIGGMARYEWPSFFNGTMAIQADFYAKDKFHVEIVNNPANDVPSFIEGNARIQYTDASGKYQVTFFVNNLADNIHIRRIQDQTNSGGYVTPFYAPGRWIGGTIRANFDF